METSDKRVDLYWDVHKGLRFELFGRLSGLGRLNLDDDEAVTAFVREFDRTCALLADHAAHEESCVHPLLEAQYAELLAELESDHGELDRKLTATRRAIQQLATATSDQRGAAGADAYRLFSDFVGSYVVHMGREEREAMSALWGLYDDSVLLEVQQRIRGSIAPPRMAEFLQCMIPAMNLAERTTMLSGMRANAPADAFDGVCNLAQSILSDAEWSAVRERVGIHDHAKS